MSNPTPLTLTLREKAKKAAEENERRIAENKTNEEKYNKMESDLMPIPRPNWKLRQTSGGKRRTIRRTYNIKKGIIGGKNRKTKKHRKTRRLK
jgi:hypothetical protein